MNLLYDKEGILFCKLRGKELLFLGKVMLYFDCQTLLWNSFLKKTFQIIGGTMDCSINSVWGQ